MKGFLPGAVLSLALAGLPAPVAAGQYLPGGPLAGLKLPPFPTQHGEPPGHPGCLPERVDPAKADPREGWVPFTPQGLAPEWELYPDSVEHWRAYWFKYCPVRSSFDRQSLVKNFLARDLPGVKPAQVEAYAAPVYWIPRYSGRVDTGKRLKPVPVVRCRVNDPVFRLDLGVLERGMYAIRVIGAVETKNLRPFLEPIYIKATVNDGLGGEGSTYRVRIAYNDEFYSVAEIYFHAPIKRAYRATLAVDRGSTVDLLVHNITLDDALAGARREAIKKRTTLAAEATFGAQYSERYIRKRTPLTPEERLRRDAAIWNAFPPLNKAGCIGYARKNYVEGVDGKTMQQVNAEFGAWEVVRLGEGNGGRENHIGVFPQSLDHTRILMRNRKLRLAYTLDDLAANRPLPDPYPYKDDGAGLYQPDPKDPAKGLAFMPIAWAMAARIHDYTRFIGSGGKFFRNRAANEDYARDSAVALCRFAYAFPSLDIARYTPWLIHDPGPYGRDLLRRRPTMASSWGNFIRFLVPIRQYDELYDYIKGNEELARSIHRFVPWVETSEDVIELIDVFLVQTMAKRMMRYQYYGDGRQPTRLAELCTLVGNREVTDDWMEWLFSRTFFYPKSPSGIQDLMITGTDRDGMSPIGSYAYMIGEASGARIAEKLEQYLKYGGNPKYDLRGPRRYPKTLTSLDFDLRSHTAGLYFPRIGDVSGPDKPYGYGTHGAFLARMRRGWRWTKDPRFAYVLHHYAGEKGPDIVAAAAKLERPPWMDARTRVLPGWAALLESGTQHDDFRFRRSVMLRVGYGWGHAHYDIFDLQIHAHGVPMTINPGQRGGYSDPGDRNTRMHNTVVVNGKNWLGHNWVRNLVSVPGAHVAIAQAAPKYGTRLFRRQVALMDVDEGKGSRRLTPAQMGPNPADMPKDVVTPNSYVFDVLRVAGPAGEARHLYCFHGSVNDPDGPQPKMNARNVQRLAKPADPKDPRLADAVSLIGDLKNETYFGTAPDVLEVVYPLQKKRVTPGVIREAGTESLFLGRAYDPAAPDKFLKLRLFGQKGALVAKGDQHCYKWQYYIPHVFVLRKGKDLDSVFTALMEPYAGEPFIASAKALPIADNETDALRAVALEVKTRNGHTDLLFSDGRPDRVRKVGGATVSAEFACLSRDDRGLRLALLTGGTRLAAPDVTIEVAVRERTARVVQADYLEKTIVIDAAWPALAEGQGTDRRRLIEIGTLPESGRPGYCTAYEPVSIAPKGRQTVIRFRRGADYYRSRIKSLVAAKGVVNCALGAPGYASGLAGLDKRFTASNDALTKFWRADVLAGDRSTASYPFRLYGADGRPDTSLSEKDFAPQGALRLWEYGVGDTVRRSTFVSVRRLDATAYAVDGDVDVTLTLKGKTFRLKAAQFAAGPVTVRVP